MRKMIDNISKRHMVSIFICTIFSIVLTLTNFAGLYPTEVYAFENAPATGTEYNITVGQTQTIELEGRLWVVSSSLEVATDNANATASVSEYQPDIVTNTSKAQLTVTGVSAGDCVVTVTERVTGNMPGDTEDVNTVSYTFHVAEAPNTFVRAEIEAPDSVVKGQEFRLTYKFIFSKAVSYDDQINFAGRYTTSKDDNAVFVRDGSGSLNANIYVKSGIYKSNVTGTLYFSAKWDNVVQATKTITVTEQSSTPSTGSTPSAAKPQEVTESSDDSSTPPAEPENEFAKAVDAANAKLEDTLRQISAYDKAGNKKAADELRKNGITLDNVILNCYGKDTYSLIYKLTKLGVPVKIDFIIDKVKYTTAIPAYTKLDPTSLCDKTGYSGFLNIKHHYGGSERK